MEDVGRPGGGRGWLYWKLLIEPTSWMGDGRFIIISISLRQNLVSDSRTRVNSLERVAESLLSTATLVGDCLVLNKIA